MIRATNISVKKSSMNLCQCQEQKARIYHKCFLFSILFLLFLMSNPLLHLISLLIWKILIHCHRNKWVLVICVQCRFAKETQLTKYRRRWRRAAESLWFTYTLRICEPFYFFCTHSLTIVFVYLFSTKIMLRSKVVRNLFCHQ